MKIFFATLMTFISLSSHASNLAHDLASKDCAIKMRKAVTIKKNQVEVSAGDITLMSLFHNSKVKLNSGKTYPILNAGEESIAINQGTSLILVCVNDGDSCLKNLSLLNTADIYQLSNKTLSVVCH